ncbi:transposase [Streptomyces sp. NPDC005480]|uniref:transposase n=1 Tax=Streptomyces sp. NPDC005480 TaxID=3154880 RepID=UPI0033B073B5
MAVFLLLGGSECVVSVQPRPWPEPDPQVAAVIRAIYRGRREVPLAVQVRDRLGELFPDAVFAEGFGKAGKPGWSPGRLALVTVLQKAASLTDRQAADEVRENLAWKYALGLGWTIRASTTACCRSFARGWSLTGWRSGCWTCCCSVCRRWTCWPRAGASAPIPRILCRRCGT